MVILDYEYCKKHQRSKFIGKKSHVTHLYMNDRKITEIQDISKKYSYIAVAYLHDNCLNNCGQLRLLKNLTHLYLQWNKLSSTQDLNDLPNLTHLYLGYNSISNVNGLKAVPYLKVFHIQKQRLKDKSSLNFDQETIASVSKSLQELDISGNNLSSLKDLATLWKLEILDASDNLLSNKEDICNAIKGWKLVKNLKLCGNLVTKQKNYEHDIIVTAPSLYVLNDKEISNARRIFLQGLIKMRNKRMQRISKKPEFSLETRSFIHQLPLEVRELVSRSVIHNRKHGNFGYLR